MSALARLLARRIRLAGPITIADYMAEALGHPGHGYYRRGAPIGAAGDFVTAPEVSQIFGELLGLWCVEGWLRLCEPDPVVLVELGPGRGTLMGDALRAARVRPRFLSALCLHLVETSATLRPLQQAAIAAAAPSVAPHWHEDLAAVPEGPLLLLANEFFDALPVHQFERTPDGWRERLVTADAEGRLRPALGPPGAALALLSPAQRGAPAGSVVEVSPAALRIAGTIGRRVAAHGGAALVIDYAAGRPARGPWPATLRAARGHRWQDPLADPGLADLTADVDFAALGRAAVEAGARAYGPLPQGALLRRLGITLRAAALRRRATPSQAAAIDAGVRRLLAADEMGRVFRALAIVGPGSGPPPGFEEEDAIDARDDGDR